MTNEDLRKQPVTGMYTAKVRPEKISEYREWLLGINADVKQRQGFVSVDVIGPDSEAGTEFITLVKFAGPKYLKNWNESKCLADWLGKLPELLAADSHSQERVGLELWFDRPKIAQGASQPAYWKRVFIGVVCVFPLINLLRWALSPITGQLPEMLGLLFNVVVLSCLLTYPVMPFATRFLRNWLYPNRLK
jgi:uncharacterized protein